MKKTTLRFSILFMILLFKIGCTNVATAPEVIDVPSKETIELEAKKYKLRYGVDDLYTKIVDNKGKGDKELYGARNMRVVLHGVMYRGGANNLYFDPPRGNSNPLPTVGLTHLCEQGFSSSVYLYSTNFSSAPTSVNCKNSEKQMTALQYKQLSPVTSHEQILQMVYDRIKGQTSGPVYAHCWNGWHYSGLISALALRQFCGWSGAEAEAYWVRNTDGNSEGYKKLRKIMNEFKPFEKFAITEKERAAICPAL